MADSSLGELGAASIAIKADISSFLQDTKAAKTELQGLESAAKAPENAFQQMFNKGSEAASGMREGFIGAKEAVEAFIAALALEKIAELVKGSLESAQALKDLSEQTGLTTTKIQELQYRALQFGISTEEMTTGLLFFSKSFGAFLNDQSGPGAKAFEALGVKAGILNGTIRNAGQAFDVAATHMRTLQNANSAAAYSTELFGRQLGVRLAPALRQSAEEAQNLTDQAHKLGFVLGEEAVEAAAQANIKLNTLWQTTKKDFTSEIIKLSPEIESLAKQLIADLPAVTAWVNQWLLWFGAIDQHSMAGLDAQIAEAKSQIAGLEEDKKNLTGGFGASLIAGANAIPGLGPIIGGLFAGADFKGITNNIDTVKAHLAQLTAERDKLLKQPPGPKAAPKPPEPPLHLGASKEEIDAAKKLADERAALAEKITAYDAAMATADDKASKDMLAAQDQAAIKSAENSNQKIQQFEAEIKASKDLLAAEIAVINAEKQQQLSALDKLNAENKKLTAQEYALKHGIDQSKVTPAFIDAHGYDMDNIAGQREAIEQETQDRIAAVQTKAQSDQQTILHDRIEYENQAAYQIRDVWISSINDSFSAFENFVENGGSAMEALSSLAKQVANDIFNTFLRLSVENPLLNMLYGGQPGFNLLPTIGVGGNGYGSGGALGGIANWLGIGSGGGGAQEALGGGDFIGTASDPSASGGVLGAIGNWVSDAWTGLGLANGGPVNSGDMYMVGEQGPELFVSDRAGEIVPHGQLGSVGSSTGHTFNFNFNGPTDGGSVLRAQSQIEAMVTRAASRGQRGL